MPEYNWVPTTPPLPLSPTIPSVRRRIAVSQSVKGVLSFDCTCESEGLTRDQLLAESDALVAELKKRYPPIPEKKEEGK